MNHFLERQRHRILPCDLLAFTPSDHLQDMMLHILDKRSY